mmetsp:Transcript_23002/g.59128  ORF Transcript_23002/g.59128 Transcript_23002/m.59128 type:complete len:214 (+) Transcript_23002:171-812(+)
MIEFDVALGLLAHKLMRRPPGPVMRLCLDVRSRSMGRVGSPSSADALSVNGLVTSMLLIAATILETFCDSKCDARKLSTVSRSSIAVTVSVLCRAIAVARADDCAARVATRSSSVISPGTYFGRMPFLLKWSMTCWYMTSTSSAGLDSGHTAAALSSSSRLCRISIWWARFWIMSSSICDSSASSSPSLSLSNMRMIESTSSPPSTPSKPVSV